jgi:hypothetical protein
MLRSRPQPGPIANRAWPPPQPYESDLFLEAAADLGRAIERDNVSVTPSKEHLTFPLLLPVSRVVNIANTSPTLVCSQNLNRVQLRIPNTMGATFYISYSADDLQGIPIKSDGQYLETMGNCVASDLYLRAVTTGTVRVYEYFRVPAVRAT